MKWCAVLIVFLFASVVFAQNECATYRLDWNGCLLPVTRTAALTELISSSSGGGSCANMTQISTTYPSIASSIFKKPIADCIRASGTEELCVDFVVANPCTCIARCAEVYPLYMLMSA